MNKRTTIVLSLILFMFSILIITFYRLNFDGNFSSDSSDWANFSTYFSGFISPFISIIGFYFIIVTIQKGDKTNKIANIINAIRNIEEQIERILNKKIYIQYQTDIIFEQTIRKALILNISTKNSISKISDHKDMNQLNSQTMEIRDLRSLLIMLSELLGKITDIDRSNSEWISIYKFKYHIITNCITQYQTYYFANIMHEQENKGSKLHMMSKTQESLLKFYQID